MKQSNANILKKSIKQAAINESVIIRKVNEYGTHYNMKFLFKTYGGESLILVAWIIRTYDVLGWLAAGMPHEEILDDFPELTEEDIKACLEFAANRGRY